MAALTNLILRHKRLVAVAWIVVAIVGMATAQRATEALSTSFSLPGQPAFETNTIILRQYHTGGRIPVLVPVITLPSALTVDSPGIRAKLRSAFERVAAAVPGSRVASYASTGNRMFVSHDGHTTFGLVFIPPGPLATFGLNPLAMSAVRRGLAGISIVGARWHVTGMDALRVTNGGGEGPGLLAETLIGGTGALLVLIFVFGSVLAFVPLLMAAVAIPTSFLLVWGLASITSVNFIVQFLIALIGLGVAIDYSLLIVTRWREERAHGLDNDAAVQRAMETAGRAVIFSGTTVGISLLAMVTLPVPFLRSMGYAGLLIPIVSVLVAITFLPVLLAAIGPRLDWPHLRQEGHASRAWTRWAQLMVRRRWIAAGVALVILALLMVPAVHIHLTDPKVDSLASTGDAHAGLVVLERAGIGPGALNPVEVLVPSSLDATHVAATLARLPGVRGAVAPRSGNWARSGSRMVDVVLAADTSSDEGQATLSRVRDAVKAPVRVGGPAAENQDFVSAVYGNFPLMALLITLLTTLLLMRVFRSVLLPLKAIVLNLLSLGAAMGAMVLIWQMGYGSKAIWGIESTGSITPWLPIMIFAFLFGLSMDYEVFILVRMREEYDATGSTRAAVVTGLGRTGRLVTCAALILFLAFMSLASGPDTEAKVGATGLAVGILLDATLIRALLVPALVSLFGRWNWWLPALPARLLRVQPSPARIERATAPAPSAE